MRDPERRLEVVVVTGLSGSGKSTAIHVLEDLGYYCIDNLPVVLLPRFLELCESSLESLSRVALGVDIREREFLAAFPAGLEEARRAGYRVRLLFLDASDDVLIRRFSETRRPHPLGGDGGPTAGIQRERTELSVLRERADLILDTSALTVHQLRQELRSIFGDAGDETALTLQLMSFGFKYGAPTNVDMVFDVRFLANPFFVDTLRDLNGRDQAVASYVLEREAARGFISRVVELLRFALPLHENEGRSYITVAVGCTGGHHRSVAVVERLAKDLDGLGTRIQVKHRDVER